MSGGSKETTQQQNTTTNTTDPALMAMLKGNYSTAQTNAAKLDSPYGGQLTAGFNPTQIQAQGVLSGVGTDPRYAATNNSAINSIQGVLGANPTTNITPNAVNASTIAGSDLSQYENPYTKDVVNASINQNERAREIAGVSDAQHADAAGAFGGSRSGVVSALTNEAYDRNNQTNIAALNSANYNQAQSAAATDASTRNQVGEFNSGQDVNAQQSSFANANTAAGTKLNAAGQLVSDNNAALGTATAQGGVLGAVGDAQQAQSQNELSAAYQAYLTGQSMTVQQQQLLNSALGLIPNQQTVNSSGSGSSTTTSSPGIAGILGGLGSLGMGLGKSGLGLAL